MGKNKKNVKRFEVKKLVRVVLRGKTVVQQYGVIIIIIIIITIIIILPQLRLVIYATSISDRHWSVFIWECKLFIART